MKNLLEKIIDLYYSSRRFFIDLYWDFNYRFVKKHQYNIVRTGLKPGYWDSDHILLHAAFQVLVDFIEKDIGKEDAIIARKELYDLYLWWKETRVKDLEDLNNMHERVSKMVNITFKGKAIEFDYLEDTNIIKLENERLRQFQETLNKRDENNLIKLCKLRKELWC